MNVMQLLLKKFKRKINKVIKGGSILSILFALMISLATPPFNIYSDTWISPTYYDSSVRVQWATYGGTVENYSEDPLTASTPSHLTFTFDNHYYGYLSFTGYYGSTSDYVSGTCFVADGQGIWNYRNVSNATKKYIDAVRIDYINLVIPDSSVDLTQIIDLLTAIESDTTSIDTTLDTTLIAIQNVLSQLIVSNGYLDTLTEMRQWNFPIESYQAVMYMLSNNYELLNFHKFDYYTFPLFKINNGDIINRTYINNNQTFTYICAMNNNVYSSVLNNFFSVDYGILQNFKNLGRFSYGNIINCYLFSFEILNNSGTSRNINLSYIGADNKFIMPIYFRPTNSRYISTDFALQFGLTNDLLDNLNIIANGTTQSNQSSSDLNNQTSSFDTASNSLYTSENAFNTDMNTKLQSIDTAFNPSTSFGSKFLSSADWVRTQFNNLTSTSPFGTVLSFSMLLGLSLLIIGKVFK